MESRSTAAEILFLRNKIVLEAAQTSAITLNNEFGPLRNIIIGFDLGSLHEENYLEGGGYTLYCDDRNFPYEWLLALV